jgi:sulfatase modifying factor 1
MKWLLLFAIWPSLASAYERIVVVTVGISDYRHDFSDLPNGALDAERFARLMESNPWLGRVTVSRVAEKDATITGIKGTLRAAGRTACADGGCTDQRRSLVVFYFVGHGMTHGDEGFIVPREGKKGDPDTWLTVVELRSLLSQEELRPVPHVLFVLSSCFSGTLLRSDTIPTDAELRAASPAMGGYITAVLGRQARVGIAAGTGGQSVPDGPPGQGSDFGRALINALTPLHGLPDMAADQNRDGCVNHLELASYLHNKGQSEHNHPTLGTMAYDDGGTVLLCRLKRPAVVKAPGPIENPKGPEVLRAPATEPPVAVESKPAPAAERPNPAGIDWVFIFGGNFVMGSDAGENDEIPAHSVTVSAFEMGRSEVTTAQWKACVAAGKCPDPTYVPCWDERSKTIVDDPCPMVNVSWDEAASFATWARGRLPTEAEWEYAARSAGREQAYPWGNESPTCAHAVFDDGGRCGSGDLSKAVCLKRAGDTEQGLCDMAGNVLEWTQDWYGAYHHREQLNPTGPAGGRYRVVRGGSWSSFGWDLRVVDRNRVEPAKRSRSVGFRIVRRP